MGLARSLIGVRAQCSLTQSGLTHRVWALPDTVVPATVLVLVILPLIVSAQLGAEGKALLLAYPLLLPSDLLCDAQLSQVDLKHVGLGRLENFSRAVHKDTTVSVRDAADLTLA